MSGSGGRGWSLRKPREVRFHRLNVQRAEARSPGLPGLSPGSEEQLERTLEESERSGTVNTSFVERYHGTQRHFNARKKRKAYTFSKELGLHEAATWLVVLWYNLGWCVRTLREKVQEDPPRYRPRTPAMAAGLTDHAWTMEELLRYPLYPTVDPRPKPPPRTYRDVLERLRGVIDAGEATG